MFSRSTAQQLPFVEESATLNATAAERRDLTVTVAAVLAVAGFGLILPTPSAGPAASVEAMSVSTAHASFEAPAKVAPPVEAMPVAPASAPVKTVNGACSELNWPYVCDAADKVRRVRVISTDRNAPASIMVSVQEAPRAVTGASHVAAHPNMAAPKTAVAAEPVVASSAVPERPSAEPVADAAPSAPIRAVFTPAEPSKAKQASRTRKSDRKVARRSGERRQLLASRDDIGSDGALAYGSAPRHRLDSYPWIGGGFR